MKRNRLSMVLAAAVLAVGLQVPAYAETLLEPTMVKTVENTKGVGSVTLSFGQNVSEKVIPIKAEEKGGLIAAISQNFSKEFLSLTLNVYEDETCTIPCGDSIYLLGDKIANTGSFATPKSGIYYVKAVLDRKAEKEEEISFSLNLAFLSSEDRKLEKKVFACTFDDSTEETADTLYTVTVDKPGVLAFGVVSLEEEQKGNFYLSLYDKKGKKIHNNYALQKESEITDLLAMDGAAGVFAVTKGTYQVKVSSFENYAVGYDLIAVDEKSGKTKKKAVPLKVGKARKGIIEETASTEEQDWYQIVLPKKAKFSLELDAISNSNLEFQMVDSKGNVMDGSVADLQTTGYKISTKGKWKKGVYYLTVRKTREGSGFYSVKLKR